MQRDIQREFFCASEGYAYRTGKRILFGIALIVLGVLFLLERQGYIPSHTVGHYWPLLFCVMGMCKLFFSRFAYRKAKGLIQIFLGFWVFACLEHLWGWTFAMTWPMILIAVGVCYICSFLFKNNSIDTGNAS